ncbi:MAG: hypothetical protein ACR2GL_01330 [Thermoleophilaceae bacterium]
MTGAGKATALRGALVALALLGPACGGSAGEDSTPGGGSLAPEGSELRRLEIAVTEPAPGRFRYLAPKTVRAGLVEIRFTNAGKATHKAQLWRVGAGHTVTEARRTRRPLPPWLRTAGGVGLTAPGATGATIQRLAPGTYYVAGAGDEPGVVARFRATAGGGGADERDEALPAASARVTAVDYGYRLSGIEAGASSVEFRNAGREPHHAFFSPLRAGRTLAEARAFFAGKAVGPPPVDPEQTRETVVLEGGERQVTRLNLQSGRYALLCFVRDRAGGPPHTEKGMVAEVEVP